MERKHPWEDVPHIWKNDKAFHSWLRSQIRRIWSKHPLKLEYKKSRRYKAPVGRNSQEVWVSNCELCGKQSRETEIDHLEGGHGFTDWDSFCKWAKRILYVTYDDVRELCIDCHAIITHSQKTGLSFEKAKLDKERIMLLKQPVEVKKAFLEKEGYHPIPKTKKGLDELINKLYEERSK